MNKIEKLIEEFCPQGVEFRALGEVSEVANKGRKPIRADLRVSGNIPYYGANNIQDHVEGFTHDGNYVLIAEDGSASLDNYSIQYTEGKFWANNHVHVIKGAGDLNNRFLFHYLRSMNFRSFLSGGDRAKLTKTKMVGIKIPIPPLTIQKEIVKILDNFTQLEAELEAELEARKKQYEHYREALLTFGDDVEFRALGEVVKINTGKLNANAMVEDGKYPFFTCAEKPFLINDYAFNTEAILISGNGSQVGHINYYKGKFNAYQRTYVLSEFHHEISVLFLLFCLADRLKDYILKNVKEGSVPYITLPMLKKFQIPIPPLTIQKEIVKILDNFTRLEAELEAELEARKKQYEYYRNQLLDFKVKSYEL